MHPNVKIKRFCVVSAPTDLFCLLSPTLHTFCLLGDAFTFTLLDGVLSKKTKIVK